MNANGLGARLRRRQSASNSTDDEQTAVTIGRTPKGVFVYVGNADGGYGAFLSPEKAREVGGWLIEEAAAWEE